MFKTGRGLEGLDLVIFGINFQYASETPRACTESSFRILSSFHHAHIVAVLGYVRVILHELPLFCVGENLQVSGQQKPFGPQVDDMLLALYLQEVGHAFGRALLPSPEAQLSGDGDFR